MTIKTQDVAERQRAEMAKLRATLPTDPLEWRADHIEAVADALQVASNHPARHSHDAEGRALAMADTVSALESMRRHAALYEHDPAALVEGGSIRWYWTTFEATTEMRWAYFFTCLYGWGTHNVIA